MNEINAAHKNPEWTKSNWLKESWLALAYLVPFRRWLMVFILT
jgi:hypothetical protein